MQEGERYRKVDLMVFGFANLMNVVMVIIFLTRVAGLDCGVLFGVIWILFIVGLSIAVYLNACGRRAWWWIILPSLLIAFLILEILLDYVLQIDFRHTWLLGPYLLMYYLALFGMIGYSFMIGKKFGFVTLVTYFIHQIAAFYSYFRVGHG